MSYFVSYVFEEKEEIVPTVKEALIKAYRFTKAHPRNISVEIYKYNADFTHLYTISWHVVDGKRQIVLFADSKAGDSRYHLMNADGSRKPNKLRSYHVDVGNGIRFRTVR